MALDKTSSAVWQNAELVQKAKEIGARYTEKAVGLAQDIARISAPTGDEGMRAEFVAELFRSHGIPDVSVDAINDVVAVHPGKNPGSPLLLAAHIDTVFVEDTPLNIHSDTTKAFGPGVGDNSLGVAAVILMAEMLEEFGQPLSTALLLTGNVGEEGLGNLRGINKVLDTYPDIGAVVAIEGQNLGRITHIAVGSVRLRVVVTGPGGHSWGDFGNPNAILAAARIIESLEQIPLTQSPKTTLSVGMISGGISINSIAPEVTLDIDLRSTDPTSLSRLLTRVLATIDSPYKSLDPRIKVKHNVLGERPAGQASANSRIVTSAAEILRSLSCPPSADASSTDANAAIARGIPAICIGMTTGGSAHRMDEYIDIPPIGTGLAQLLLLSLSLSDDLAAGRLTGPA